MLWISFFLYSVFAEEPLSTDLVVWSDEQVLQERLPLLEGENAALQRQIDEKQSFFIGEVDFYSAFWKWRSEDLLNLDVLKGLLLSLLSENQTRLQSRYVDFPFEQPSSSGAQQYEKVYENNWQLKNELDAINLRVLDVLIENVSQYSDLGQRLDELEHDWLRRSAQFKDESTQKQMVSDLMKERQKVRTLKEDIIRCFAMKNVDVASIGEAVLQEVSVTQFNEEGRLTRLSILKPLLEQTPLKDKVQEELGRLEAVKLEQERQHLVSELEDVRENWRRIVSEWDVETTEKNIQEFSSRLQSLPSDNQAIHREIVEYKLSIVREHQNTLNGIQVETELQRAQEELEAAKRKELEETQTENQAKIQSEIVRLNEIKTALLTQESERHRLVQGKTSELKRRLEVWQENFLEWEKLPPLDSSRKSKLIELQQSIHLLQWELQEDIHKLNTVESPTPIESVSDDSKVVAVLDSIKTVQADSIDHVQTETRELLLLWVQVHQKQQLVGHFEEENIQFWSDIVFEWQYLSDTISLKIESGRNLLRDVNQIVGILSSLFRLFIVGLLWMWIGRRVENWWQVFTTWLEQQDRSELFEEFDFQVWDGTSERKTLQPNHVVEPLFYAVSALVLEQYWMGGSANVLATGLLLWMFLRLCKPLAHSLAEDPNIQGPLQKGLMTFVWIYFGLNFLEAIFVMGLSVFQSIQILHTVQQLLLGLWVLVQLGGWYEILYQAASDVIGLDNLKRWMNRPSIGILGRRIRTVVAMSILFLDWISRIMFWFVEHSSFLGSTLAKNAIESNTEAQGIAYDTSEWTLNWKEELYPAVSKVYVDLQAMLDATNQVSGSMCLIADEGMGKSQVLKMVLEEAAVPTYLLKVDTIERTETWNVETLVRWLCEGLKIPTETTPEAVCKAIENLPNSLIGIDDIQRVFLREVQGFEVVNELFAIIQGTSDKHCWIVSCHQPTWTFWDSPATPIRTDFFNHTYSLQPWSVLKMRSTLVEMTNHNGVELDFTSLSSINNSQAIHRAEMAFWRLLTDSTKGNPSTALRLFKQCAVTTADPKSVKVKMFPMNQAETLNRLDDGAGFVLACVLMHNRCTLNELCNSLQIAESVIVSICRQLVEAGVLKTDQQHYQVDSIWFPWIEANLAQKRFIVQRDRR